MIHDDTMAAAEREMDVLHADIRRLEDRNRTQAENICYLTGMVRHHETTIEDLTATIEDLNEDLASHEKMLGRKARQIQFLQDEIRTIGQERNKEREATK